MVNLPGGGIPYEKDGSARRARRHQWDGGEGIALALYFVYDPRTGLVLLLNLSMI